jgi:cytochrome c5
MALRHGATTRVWRRAAALLIAAAAGPAWAEMSDEAYRSPAGAVPPAQRSRVAAELQAARASEAAAAALASAQAEARARELAARRAQRPVGEQLLEARCSGCHVTALVEGSRYGAIGWRWTVERMRWWHGAPVMAGEAAAIARHLTLAHPATASQVWKERTIAVALLIALLAVAGAMMWRWRRRWVSARG